MLGERSKNKLIEAETTLVVETAAVKKAEIIIPKVTVSTEISAEEKVCLLVHALNVSNALIISCTGCNKATGKHKE